MHIVDQVALRVRVIYILHLLNLVLQQLLSQLAILEIVLDFVDHIAHIDRVALLLSFLDLQVDKSSLSSISSRFPSRLLLSVNTSSMLFSNCIVQNTSKTWLTICRTQAFSSQGCATSCQRPIAASVVLA